MKRFCVVGSLNMDMSTRVGRFPKPGETIVGLSFSIFPGGKGANQAVALSRLGAEVSMVGAIGNDILGVRYASILKNSGVDLRDLETLPGTATGTASIEVNEAGENHIIIVAGANRTFDAQAVERHRERIAAADFLLLQLEIPMGGILAAARIARAAGKTIILDPAPAQELPAELYRTIDVITPNETEASLLTGEDASSEAGMLRAGAKLADRGTPWAIIKAGRRGAYLIHDGRMTHFPTFPVRTVDTVAAGDSFNAGLALALGEGKSFEDAVSFANAVAALSTTREGAQSAMPSRAEADALIAGKA